MGHQSRRRQRMFARLLRMATLAGLAVTVAVPLGTAQAGSKHYHKPAYKFHHIKPAPYHRHFGKGVVVVPHAKRKRVVHGHRVPYRFVHRNNHRKPWVGPKIVKRHKLARPVTRHNFHRRHAKLHAKQFRQLHGYKLHHFKEHHLRGHNFKARQFKGRRFAKHRD